MITQMANPHHEILHFFAFLRLIYIFKECNKPGPITKFELDELHRAHSSKFIIVDGLTIIYFYARQYTLNNTMNSNKWTTNRLYSHKTESISKMKCVELKDDERRFRCEHCIWCDSVGTVAFGYKYFKVYVCESCLLCDFLMNKTIKGAIA